MNHRHSLGQTTTSYTSYILILIVTGYQMEQLAIQGHEVLVEFSMEPRLRESLGSRDVLLRIDYPESDIVHVPLKILALFQSALHSVVFSLVPSSTLERWVWLSA